MRRARHVITENDRVMQAKQAMLRGNATELGKLLIASHISLRDDFEVSGDALNAIVDCANEQTSCFGARMTGAGFNGYVNKPIMRNELRELIAKFLAD